MTRRLSTAYALGLLLIGPCSALAQELGAPEAAPRALPDLQSLYPKTAPAFTLLGVEPTAVQRPSTPADLALSLLDQTRSLDAVPTDVAAEVAPYWLLSRPALTWQEDVTRNVADSFLKTLAFSFATSALPDSPETVGAAVGFRASLRSGHIPPRVVAQIEAAERLLNRYSSLRLRADVVREGGLDSLFRAGQGAAIEVARLDPAEGRPLLDSVQAAYRLARAAVEPVVGGRSGVTPGVRAAVNALRDAALRAARGLPDGEARARATDAVIEAYGRTWEGLARPVAEAAEAEALLATLERTELRLERAGLFWEVAGGAGWAFPGARWADARAYRQGFWTTLSYEGALPVLGGDLVPLASARYLRSPDSTLAQARDLFDAGGRLILSDDRFTASAELLLRFSSDDTDDPSDDGRDYRLAGLLEYALRPDLWIRAAFGRDFEAESEGNLLALVGLTFSLQEARYGVGGAAAGGDGRSADG